MIACLLHALLKSPGAATKSFSHAVFTTYDRDGNLSDEVMHGRNNRWHMRFDQPELCSGSYNPQSFNRYSCVQNDPVNFVDPFGLDPQDPNDPPPTSIPRPGKIKIGDTGIPKGLAPPES